MQFNRIDSCSSKQSVLLHAVLQVRYWLYLTTLHNPTSKEPMPLSTLQCSQDSELANSKSTLEWEFQKKKRKFAKSRWSWIHEAWLFILTTELQIPSSLVIRQSSKCKTGNKGVASFVQIVIDSLISFSR